MFTSLPDFTPRDSHSIWYRSALNPFTPPTPHHSPPGDSHHQRQNGHHSRQRENLLERSALARLAADEQCIQRRRLNIQNYGSGWLKPPGVPKTLHQMREEKREQEEHQEALRREQLAQELAEAEAGNNPEDGMMGDVQLDGAQDLDDDIPDAEDEYGLPDDDDDDDEVEDEENEESDEDDYRHAQAPADESVLREERQNDLIAARMRMSEDAFREALVRGEGDGGDMYGGDDEIDEEDQGHILDEDDFAHDDDGLGMDMDADLDDDIPEADEGGGYEHTDSEAELSSSEEEESDEDDEEEEEVDMSFMPRSAAMPPPSSPTLHPRPSTGGRASIMDLSNILSQDGSSFMESSPAAGRRARQ
ncbi:Apc15p protein-domain-containing protein [Thelonectria olida]|uniref:Apc15p protein-domain-containing protein n=1 Tax=Thelonectria olida TaxID=1576542 RepID=A0A9P9AM80_9HYPO|nr:Apc15p protein-domain-containing protein [Thelonectria olida]